MGDNALVEPGEERTDAQVAEEILKEINADDTKKEEPEEEEEDATQDEDDGAEGGEESGKPEGSGGDGEEEGGGEEEQSDDSGTEESESETDSGGDHKPPVVAITDDQIIRAHEVGIPPDRARAFASAEDLEFAISTLEKKATPEVAKEDIKPFELKFEEDVELDPSVKSQLEGLNEHYAKQLAEINKVNEQKLANIEMLLQQEQNDRLTAWLDAKISERGEVAEAVFGKKVTGVTSEKDIERVERALKTFDHLAATNPQATDDDLFEMTVSALNPKGAKNEVKNSIKSKAKKQASQRISKPTSNKGADEGTKEKELYDFYWKMARENEEDGRVSAGA